MRSSPAINTLKTLVLLFCLTASLSTGAADIVNINRANAAAMIENWKGIGEVKAKAIVAYRKKNGPFKSIEDLTNVKGIGDELVKKNRKLMSTSRGAAKPAGNTGSGHSTGKSVPKKAIRKKKSTANQQSTSGSGNTSKPASSSSSKKKDKKQKKTSNKKKPNT